MNSRETARLSVHSEVQALVYDRFAVGHDQTLIRDRKKPPAGRTLWLAVTLAMIVVAVSSVPMIRRLLDPLGRVQGTYRLLQPRLSRLPYAPLRPMRSAASDSRHLLAVGELLEQSILTPSFENLARAAVAQLAVGRVTRGREILSGAVLQSPPSATVLSDLGAADLAAGRVAEAAEESARALQMDGTLQPAAFNWALALELLANRPAAVDAWEQYLRLDPASGWSAEAREHLARLQQPRSTWQHDGLLLTAAAGDATLLKLVARYPQRIRVGVQAKLLPRWVENRDAGDLALLRRIGRAREAKDPFLRDVVENAVASSSPDLVSGMRAFAAAEDALGKRDMDVANASYVRAAELLDRAGSPLALVARIGAASTDSYRGHGDNALVWIDDVEKRLQKLGDRYPAVAAEAGWSRGLVLARLGRSNESLQAYRGGLESAKRSGEIENEAGLAALIATRMEALNDPSEAERYRTEALRQLDAIDADRQRLYGAFAQAAFAALRAGRPRLALAYISSQQQIARLDKDPLLLAESESERALAFRDIGLPQQADSSLAEARRYAVSVKTEGLRDRVTSDIAYVEGTLNAKTTPRRAVASISNAIAISQKYKWRIRSATEYLARGEAWLAGGNPVAAEADFRAGVAEMERQRGALSEPSLRVAYFERADHLFDRLVELLIQERRTDDALSVIERKRARGLLDDLAVNAGDGPAAPLDAQAIAASVDPSVTVFAFALLDRVTGVWMIRGGKTTFVESRVSRAAVAQSIERHLAAIASNDTAGIAREGRWLYDHLLGVFPYPSAESGTFVIVADGALQSLPFATLQAGDGSFLVEHHAVVMAPSLSSFIRSSNMKSGGSGSILAVAEPAPEGWTPLPNAAAEARQIARLYRRGQLFVGDEITPEAFLASARNAGSIHFAGHGAFDTHQPAQSALVFESAAGALPLTARTVAGARLPSRPLVVLAACGTGAGKMRHNEGVDSMAAAFLQAGARSVVATLWDIDDSPSALLFGSLHRNLQNGLRASDALRNAQLSLLHGTDPGNRRPLAWGSTFVIGTL
jgi:CHAT domain-containing protein